jgi:predicted hydrocarbon binding protein
MKSVYNLSGLSDLAQNLPPDNMERQFDFSDFSQLFETLSSLFGPNGARSLAIRAGRSAMQEGIRVFRNTMSLPPEVTQYQTLEQHILIRLNRFSNFLNTVSDQQTSVYRFEGTEGFEFRVRRCPVCWGRSSAAPVCAFIEGMLVHAAEAFSGGRPFSVSEFACAASGADSCLFIIQKKDDLNQVIQGYIQESD